MCARMGGVTVRQATAHDAAAIVRVHVRSWQGAYRGLLPQAFLDGIDLESRTAGWQRLLDTASPRSAILVAEDGPGSLVGFAHLCPTRDDDCDPRVIGELTSIYALPEVFGAGHGRALMGAACARMKALAFDVATLWVLDRNERARRFYALAGWEPDGAVKDGEIGGAAVHEVRYRRDLS